MQHRLPKARKGATRRVPKRVAGGRSLRRPPEKFISHTRTPRGVQDYWSPFPTNPNFQPRDCVGLAPLRGAVRFIVRSGGLRGLRPPATFFATLWVAVRSVNYINTFASLGSTTSLRRS